MSETRIEEQVWWKVKDQVEWQVEDRGRRQVWDDFCECKLVQT